MSVTERDNLSLKEKVDLYLISEKEGQNELKVKEPSNDKDGTFKNHIVTFTVDYTNFVVEETDNKRPQ